MGKTSAEVKNRWNKENYCRLTAMVPKKEGEAFKEKCKKSGVSMNSVFIEAIEKFLGE